MTQRDAHTVLPNHQIIMFADIVGSTSLYERLGDTEARRLTADILARMAGIVRDKNGRTAAELGDELMCFFAQPADAAAAACEMHARIGEEFLFPPGVLFVRVFFGWEIIMVWGGSWGNKMAPRAGLEPAT